MVAHERTLWSTLRRDSLDMVDTQSVPKKSPDEGEEIIISGAWGLAEAGLRRFRGVRRARCLFQIGFGGADLADPDDTETGFAPAAADFDGLARAGQEANAVQTRAFLAEIDGVGALDKRMAVGVRTFDDDAESLGDASLLAALFPKVGDGLLESQTDTSFTVGVSVEIDDADFLLLAA